MSTDDSTKKATTAVSSTTKKAGRISHFFSSLSDRAIVYFFPLFLVLAEIILRYSSGIEAQTFLGPTLASIAVGFVLPLTVYKGISNVTELPNSIPEEARKAIASLPLDQFTIMPTRKRRFTSWCLVFTIIFTSIWLAILYLSNQQPDLYWFSYPVYNWLGFISYFAGFILAEIGERI